MSHFCSCFCICVCFSELSLKKAWIMSWPAKFNTGVTANAAWSCFFFTEPDLIAHMSHRWAILALHLVLVPKCSSCGFKHCCSRHNQSRICLHLCTFYYIFLTDLCFWLGWIFLSCLYMTFLWTYSMLTKNASLKKKNMIYMIFFCSLCWLFNSEINDYNAWKQLLYLLCYLLSCSFTNYSSVPGEIWFKLLPVWTTCNFASYTCKIASSTLLMDMNVLINSTKATLGNKLICVI